MLTEVQTSLNKLVGMGFERQVEDLDELIVEIILRPQYGLVNWSGATLPGCL